MWLHYSDTSKMENSINSTFYAKLTSQGTLENDAVSVENILRLKIDQIR